MKSSREAAEKAAQEALESAKDAFKAGESVRKMDYQTGLADLTDQFRSQEVGRKSVYRAKQTEALEKAAELKSKEAAKSFGGIVSPLEERAGQQTVSAQPIRSKINEFLGKKGFVDAKGNIANDRISGLASTEVKDFYSQLSSISDRLKTNPKLSDLSVLKEEMQALRSKAKFSKSMVTQFDDLYRGVNESYDNLIENVAGKEGKQAVQAARGSYRAEATLNDILEQGTSAKKMTKAIDETGRSKLKNILSPKQYDDLMKAEQELIASEKPFEKSIKPSRIPFKKGEMPEMIKKEKYKSLKRIGSKLGGGLQNNIGKYVPPVIVPAPGRITETARR
jgi:hypothetical protein